MEPMRASRPRRRSRGTPDVLQRTFLDVWRSAEPTTPTQRFSSWLFMIAHRRAVDSLRSRRHPVVDVEAVADLVGEDGRETAERYADAAEVRAAPSTRCPSTSARCSISPTTPT